MDLVRVNLVKISDNIFTNDCSVQRTYLVKDIHWRDIHIINSNIP